MSGPRSVAALLLQLPQDGLSDPWHCWGSSECPCPSSALCPVLMTRVLVPCSCPVSVPCLSWSGLSAGGHCQARGAAPQPEPERAAGGSRSPPEPGVQEPHQQDRNPAAERDQGVREPPPQDGEH